MELRASIDDFIDMLRVERQYSPETIRAYAADLRAFEQWARTRDVDDTRSLDLECFRDWLWQQSKDGLAQATLARRSATARSWSTWLQREGMTEADSAARLRSPKTKRHLPKVVAQQAMTELLDRMHEHAASGDPIAVRDVAIVELLYAAGLRVSELCGSTSTTSISTGSPPASRGRDRSSASCHSECLLTRRSWTTCEMHGRSSSPEARCRVTIPRYSSALADDASAADPRMPSSRAPYRRCRPRAARDPTPCGIPPRRTCSMAARTCGPSRRCSDTRASARRRSTRTCRPRGCARAIVSPIRAPSLTRPSSLPGREQSAHREEHSPRDPA